MTTNYEISKKLAEIGFRAECSYLWFEEGQAVRIGEWIHSINRIERINKETISYLPDNNRSCPSYDLETLLDALPDDIKYKNEYYYFFLWGNTLGYYYENSEYRDNYHMGDGIFEFSKLSLDESLADTAGRLIILLHEKNLIKF